MAQEIKKTIGTRNCLGLNPQILVCETGTLTDSFTQVCSGRMNSLFTSGECIARIAQSLCAGYGVYLQDKGMCFRFVEDQL